MDSLPIDMTVETEAVVRVTQLIAQKNPGPPEYPAAPNFAPIENRIGLLEAVVDAHASDVVTDARIDVHVRAAEDVVACKGLDQIGVE
jgi:hypothetical protein